MTERGRRWRSAVGGALAAALLAAGCDAGAPPPGADAGTDSGTDGARSSDATAVPAAPTRIARGVPDRYRGAVSDPRADPVYPEHGNPGVDALHYSLDLTWQAEERRLVGSETITFRATTDAPEVVLDFTADLRIVGPALITTIDATGRAGRAARAERAAVTVDGTDLTVGAAVERGRVYVLDLAYRGTPATVPAPTTRPDFAAGVGWRITDENETWTLQEPYGAFTWYAVNDHPSDKAYYTFRLTSDAPQTGVANGALVAERLRRGRRTTTWELAEPASSYLVTVSFADYRRTELASDSGVPIRIWAPADGPALPGDTGIAPDAMAWLEEILGPYPFATFGIVVVDGDVGMETQTMVTLGDDPYSLSGAVVVHELAHQWYGDTVSPADWSEVWMNEGMAMYLQGMWEAERRGIDVADVLDGWAGTEAAERAAAGPPGSYDPQRFGAGNIYYGPALMWHELREDIGDEEFFALLRDWPADQENDIADRDEYVAFIEDATGEELTAFFDDWLLSPTTPSRD